MKNPFAYILILLTLLLVSTELLQAQDTAKACWKFGARYAYGISAYPKDSYGDRYVQHGTAAISLTAEKKRHWLAISAPWIVRSGFRNYNSRSITQQNNYRYRFFHNKMVRPFVGGSLIYSSAKTEGFVYDSVGLNPGYNLNSKRVMTDVSVTPDIGLEFAYRHFRLDLVAQGIAGIELFDVSLISYKSSPGYTTSGSSIEFDMGRRRPFKTMRAFQIGLGYVF